LSLLGKVLPTIKETWLRQDIYVIQYLFNKTMQELTFAPDDDDEDFRIVASQDGIDI